MTAGSYPSTARGHGQGTQSAIPLSRTANLVLARFPALSAVACRFEAMLLHLPTAHRHPAHDLTTSLRKGESEENMHPRGPPGFLKFQPASFTTAYPAADRVTVHRHRRRNDATFQIDGDAMIPILTLGCFYLEASRSCLRIECGGSSLAVVLVLPLLPLSCHRYTAFRAKMVLATLPVPSL